MKNLGIVFNHLGLSQAAFFGINFVNSWVVEGNPATIFTQNVTDPCMDVYTAVMETSELIDFRGIIICTNVYQAKQVLSLPNPSEKVLYLWDLEWLRHNKDFNYYMSVLRHPDLSIVARSQTHKKQITNYCNREPVAVVNDFNFTEFLNGKK